MNELEARIAVLTPKAEDCIVISHSERILTKEQAEQIKKAASQHCLTASSCWC